MKRFVKNTLTHFSVGLLLFAKNRLAKFMLGNPLRISSLFENYLPHLVLVILRPHHSCDPRSPENKIHRSIGKKNASVLGGFSVFHWSCPRWWPWFVLKRMWLWAFLPLHCCWCTRRVGCVVMIGCGKTHEVFSFKGRYQEDICNS